MPVYLIPGRQMRVRLDIRIASLLVIVRAGARIREVAPLNENHMLDDLALLEHLQGVIGGVIIEEAGIEELDRGDLIDKHLLIKINSREYFLGCFILSELPCRSVQLESLLDNLHF